jgi:hypothetical protein
VGVRADCWRVVQQGWGADGMALASGTVDCCRILRLRSKASVSGAWIGSGVGIALSARLVRRGAGSSTGGPVSALRLRIVISGARVIANIGATKAVFLCGLPLLGGDGGGEDRGENDFGGDDVGSRTTTGSC